MTEKPSAWPREGIHTSCFLFPLSSGPEETCCGCPSPTSTAPSAFLADPDSSFSSSTQTHASREMTSMRSALPLGPPGLSQQISTCCPSAPPGVGVQNVQCYETIGGSFFWGGAQGLGCGIFIKLFWGLLEKVPSFSPQQCLSPQGLWCPHCPVSDPFLHASAHLTPEPHHARFAVTGSPKHLNSYTYMSWFSRTQPESFY